jgi:hypothetical protein
VQHPADNALGDVGGGRRAARKGIWLTIVRGRLTPGPPTGNGRLGPAANDAGPFLGVAYRCSGTGVFCQLPLRIIG